MLGFLLLAAFNASPNYVVAPGGEPIYYVMNAQGEPTDFGDKIVISYDENRKKRTLLEAKPDDDPQSNLGDFSRLKLSPDGKTLFFESEAWATSNAIHAIDLQTGKQHFVVGGSIACVLGGGEYQGDLLVSQHRYFVQGGSYNPLYLYTPAGKRVGIIALDDSEAPKFCGTNPIG